MASGTHARLLRRILGQLAQGGQAARSDDLARRIAVRGHQVQRFEAAQHLGLFAAEHRGHAGGLGGARLGHLGAAGGGQRNGVVAGDHAGDRVGGDLTDGVPGCDEVASGQQAALGQLFPRQQRRGHDQRLCHRGIGDLLGRRGGAEAGQVETAGLRPGGDTVSRPGQLEP